MSDYTTLISELLKVTKPTSATYHAENVIIDFLSDNDVENAVVVAKKIKSNKEFLSLLANGLISYDGFEKDAIELLKIAEEEIGEDRATYILSKYIGPDGVNRRLYKNVPIEVLRACSISSMIRFIEYAIKREKNSNIESWFNVLKEKIEES